MKFQANYSIKDLEKLSGIKAHTLRIWEKRYALFKPDRTETNIRYYSNDDLKRILNISQLNKSGFKISKIAEMSDSEINEKVSMVNMVKTKSEDIIDSLLLGMIDLNEVNFNKIFSDCILRMGFENTIQKVIFPFLQRIGVMWLTGSINPAQEHFVSNIIRQKLIVAIDGVSGNDDKNSKSAVLFLPENELHEMSLLYYNYVLRSRNIRTVYLGQLVPTESLLRIIEIVKPHFLIGVITNPLSQNELEKYFSSLNNIEGVKKVLITGKIVLEQRKFPAKITPFNDATDLLTHIQN